MNFCSPPCFVTGRVALQDALHVEPAIAFAAKGYDILLEKPMAVTPGDCQRIVNAVAAAGVKLVVGHVLRYTPHQRQIQQIIQSVC